MRHQAYPCSLMHLGPTSRHQSVPALWSLACTVPAGSEVKSQEWEQRLGVVLQPWSESLNGRPMLKKTLLDGLILGLSLALHCLCPSRNVTCVGEVATGEQRFERCVTGVLALLTWTPHSQWSQDFTHSYSVLPCISECKYIADARLCKQPIRK